MAWFIKACESTVNATGVGTAFEYVTGIHVDADVAEKGLHAQQTGDGLVNQAVKVAGNVTKEVAKVVDNAAETVVVGTGIGKAFEVVTGLHVKSNVFDNGIDVEAPEGTYGLFNNRMLKLEGQVIKLKSKDGDFGGNSNGKVVVHGVKLTSYNTEVDKNGIVGEANFGFYFSTDCEHKGRLIRLITPEELYTAAKVMCEELRVPEMIGDGINDVINAVCPGMTLKELCHNLSSTIWYFRVDGGVGLGVGGALKNGMDTTISFFSDKGDTKVDFTCYGCTGLCPIGFFIGVSKEPVGGKKYAIYLAPSVGMEIACLEAGVSVAVDLVLAFDDEEVHDRLKDLLKGISHCLPGVGPLGDPLMKMCLE